MLNLFKYLSSCNICYICNSPLKCIFVKDFDYSDMESRDLVSISFSLMGKLHKQSYQNYSCRINFHKKSNSFDVDFYKEDEPIQFISLKFTDLFLKQSSHRKIKIIKYCFSCGGYSATSSCLSLDFSNNSYSEIFLESELISYQKEGNRVMINNYYSRKNTEISFNTFKIHQSPLTLPLIKKSQKFEMYKKKINKYLMLI